LHYGLQIRNGWDDDWTMLRVAAESSDAGPAAGGFHSPEIALHLCVRPAWFALACVVVLFILGSFFTSLDNELCKYLLERMSLLEPSHVVEAAKVAATKQQSQIPDIAKTAAAVSKLFGSLMLAAAAYVGFRKLPGQAAG
jgi:hypothetical protein